LERLNNTITVLQKKTLLLEKEGDNLKV